MPGLRHWQDAELLMRFPIRDRRIIPLTQTVKIDGVNFKACRVEHSMRAPTVGYRVSVKTGSFFYLPDVARLPNPSAALRGVGVYIGDGRTFRRSMVRTKDGVSIGHAPIATQLGWCNSVIPSNVRKRTCAERFSPFVARRSCVAMSAHPPQLSKILVRSMALMHASRTTVIACALLETD